MREVIEAKGVGENGRAGGGEGWVAMWLKGLGIGSVWRGFVGGG